MTGFLQWLLVASLQACLVLPWVVLLVVFSRRVPASWLALLLAGGMVSVVAAPWIAARAPGVVLAVPVLEKTGLFEREGAPQVARDGGVPLPPLDDLAVREEERSGWLRLGFAVWAVGAVLFLAGRSWQMLRERLLLGKARPLAGQDLLRGEWESVVRESGARRVPWLVCHEGVSSPVMSGVLNPVLVLPAGMEGWLAAERAMLFHHEAAHLARRDVAVRVVLEVLRVVFWFHPVFPWVLRRYDLEVEKACDDAVLRAGHPPRDYAELLLAEARRNRTGGGMLSARVRALLERERSRGGGDSRVKVAAGYGILFLVLMVPAFAVKIRPWKEGVDFQPLAAGGQVSAWWRCRAGHGPVVDDWSGHGRHGRIFGAKWVKDDERGVCLEFDGVDDMLALPAASGGWSRGPLTLAMWLKPRADSDGGGLLLRGEPNGAWSGAKVHDFGGGMVDYGERELLLAGDIKQSHRGELNPGMWPGLNLFNIIALRAPVEVARGRWTHLAVVMEEAGEDVLFRCFIDGHPAGEERFPSSKCVNDDWPTDWWWFGRGESPPVQGNYYEGRMSDLVVLPLVLDEAGVRALMRGRMPE